MAEGKNSRREWLAAHFDEPWRAFRRAAMAVGAGKRTVQLAPSYLPDVMPELHMLRSIVDAANASSKMIQPLDDQHENIELTLIQGCISISYGGRRGPIGVRLDLTGFESNAPEAKLITGVPTSWLRPKMVRHSDPSMEIVNLDGADLVAANMRLNQVNLAVSTNVHIPTLPSAQQIPPMPEEAAMPGEYDKPKNMGRDESGVDTAAEAAPTGIWADPTVQMMWQGATNATKMFGGVATTEIATDLGTEALKAIAGEDAAVVAFLQTPAGKRLAALVGSAAIHKTLSGPMSGVAGADLGVEAMSAAFQGNVFLLEYENMPRATHLVGMVRDASFKTVAVVQQMREGVQGFSALAQMFGQAAVATATSQPTPGVLSQGMPDLEAQVREAVPVDVKKV